jgi:iron complex transport system substrate-binding protein
MILALRPDLILSSDLVPLAQLQQLEEQGIPYIILAARSIEDVFKDIRLVGFITGHVSEANVVVEELEERVAAVTAKTLAVNVSKPRVYVEYFPMWTYGPGSFGDDLIRLAGGANVASNTSAEYVVVTDEFLIAQDPEIIVYTFGPMFNGTTEETISERQGWSGISAVASGNIHQLEDNLISRYGPRIVDALEQLAVIVHPELF